MDRQVEFGGEVLILTGSPGSGKTTAAQLLAEEPGSPKVHIHSDDFWGYIRNGLIPPWLPESHVQNEVIIETLAGVAARFARGGYFVVLDGIFGPWHLSKFAALTAPLHYVVLRGPLETAVQRCKDRGGDTLTDSGPVADLHRQFASLGEFERHSLDVGGLSPGEVVERLIQSLESETFRLT